jgi:hypothetical protein
MSMRRRDLLALMSGAVVVWPLAGLAQQTPIGRVPRIVVLSNNLSDSLPRQRQ